MVGREIRMHILRALWIYKTMRLKGKTFRNLFAFYNFQCPSEIINSELTINIILGRNHLTKMCAVACGMHAHTWSPPPELKHTFVKNGRKQHVQHPECRYLEQFSFSTIWQPSSLWSDTNWGKKTFWDLIPAENCSHMSSVLHNWQTFLLCTESTWIITYCTAPREDYVQLI